MGVQMFSPGRIVPNHLGATLVGTGNGTGDIITRLTFRFDSVEFRQVQFRNSPEWHLLPRHVFRVVGVHFVIVRVELALTGSARGITRVH